MSYSAYMMIGNSSYSGRHYPSKKPKYVPNLKKRLQLHKEGRIPFHFPTLDRMFFAKSNKYAHKAFTNHIPHELNVMQKTIYILTGKLLGKTKPLTKEPGRV